MRKRLAAAAAAVLCGTMMIGMPMHACAAKIDESRVQAAQNKVRYTQVGSYGMIPIGGECIPDGTYSVCVDSDSKFFKIVEAELRVQDGKMELTFVIGSTSYTNVYPGKRKEASKAESSIEGTVDERDFTVFTVPVRALDEAFDCAAYSKRKKKWYDRQLLVRADSLPEGTLAFELPDYELIEYAVKNMGSDTAESAIVPEVQEATEPVETDMEDGEYSIEVNMTGGSGRASVSSPTKMIVEDGRMWAELTWSSSYYDYMIVGGQRYENLNTEGGSSLFRIPITALDDAIRVIADTTAMGDPVEIEYMLMFYEDTIGDTGLIPQVAAKRVLITAGVLIGVGAVINAVMKRRSN